MADFTHWGQVDDLGAHECAYADMYNIWWQDQHCNSKVRFLCQLEPQGTPPTPDYQNPPGGCDMGWWEYHGTCYRSFGSNLTGRPETNKDQIEDQPGAVARCASLGATLAIFPNRYHNDFVSAFMYAEGDSPWSRVRNKTI